MAIRIILIEDDVDTCHIFKEVLNDNGYNVTSFTEGKVIVDNGFTIPDLFILDNMIPGIDGIALCKFLKIKRSTRSIPIIMISSNHQIKIKALRAGASAFLAKPFKTQELLNVVSDVLHLDRSPTAESKDHELEGQQKSSAR